MGTTGPGSATGRSTGWDLPGALPAARAPSPASSPPRRTGDRHRPDRAGGRRARHPRPRSGRRGVRHGRAPARRHPRPPPPPGRWPSPRPGDASSWRPSCTPGSGRAWRRSAPLRRPLPDPGHSPADRVGPRDAGWTGCWSWTVQKVFSGRASGSGTGNPRPVPTACWRPRWTVRPVSSRADDVLVNDGPRDELQRRVRELHANYLHSPLPGCRAAGSETGRREGHRVTGKGLRINCICPR